MVAEYKLKLQTKEKGKSKYSDEYEGREGLLKLPYKFLLQQSEIHNGQLLSEIDELNDTIAVLKARIAELESENSDLLKGVLKEYRKEVKREEMYSDQKKQMEQMKKSLTALRQNNRELLNRLLWLQSHPNNQETEIK